MFILFIISVLTIPVIDIGNHNHKDISTKISYIKSYQYHTQEFENKAACEVARAKITGDTYSFCTSKGN